jgi:hypothetical protein
MSIRDRGLGLDEDPVTPCGLPIPCRHRALPDRRISCTSSGRAGWRPLRSISLASDASGKGLYLLALPDRRIGYGGRAITFLGRAPTIIRCRLAPAA